MRCKIWQRLGYLLPESAMDVNSWSLLKISNGIDIPSCYTLDKICILPGRDRRIEVFEMFDLEKQRSMVASCWLCSFAVPRGDLFESQLRSLEEFTNFNPTRDSSLKHVKNQNHIMKFSSSCITNLLFSFIIRISILRH